MTGPSQRKPTPAARAEELIPALITLLVVLAVGGVVALPISMWPFDFGDPVWRERSAALYLTTMPPFVFLVTVALIAAAHAGEYRTLRAGGVTLFVVAALTTVVVPLFGLDFLTVRHLQRQETLQAFNLEGVRLAGISTLLVPFLIWAGRKAWIAGRPYREKEPREGRGLIVGQPE